MHRCMLPNDMVDVVFLALLCCVHAIVVFKRCSQNALDHIRPVNDATSDARFAQFVDYFTRSTGTAIDIGLHTLSNTRIFFFCLLCGLCYWRMGLVKLRLSFVLIFRSVADCSRAV